ncbi:MAG: glycosyltransferase family 2 protein [Pyrinomonadaceae bacterium]
MSEHEPPPLAARAQGQNGLGISVFFPAYNDAGTITSLVSDALAVLPGLAERYEVIVVNDGSTDETGTLLDEYARTEPRLRVIHHERNRGYGGALRTGFASATQDLIFYTDGDGQYDVRELAALRPLLSDDVDIVNGYKIKRADAVSRKVIGGIYNRLARLLFRLPISDVDCDFRLMRRRAVRHVELVSSSGVICVELVRKLHAAGCVFVETPVHHYPRRSGRSQFFTLRRVSRTAFDFFILWWKLIALRSRARDARGARSKSRTEHQEGEDA